MFDKKFWVETVLGVGTLGVLVWQTEVMKSQVPRPNGSEKATPQVVVVTVSYWPVYVMGGLVLLNAGLLIAQNRKPKGPFIYGTLIVGSSAGPLRVAHTINGGALRDFQDSHNVAMVIGFDDPEVDKFEDDRIGVSQALTITTERREVMVPYSQRMMDALSADVAKILAAQDAASAIKAGFRTPAQNGKKKKRELSLNIKTWAETILVPKNSAHAENQQVVGCSSPKGRSYQSRTRGRSFQACGMTADDTVVDSFIS